MTELVTEKEMIRSIRGHLPQLLRSDPSLGDYILGVTREHFPTKVETEDRFTRMLNEDEFDREGEVFRRPEQVELDVIIRNGVLILCELKSSVSKSDMHIFKRKVRFYERHHGRQANRMIVVSPMIDDRARRVGEELGIEMYPNSLNVPVQ